MLRAQRGIAAALVVSLSAASLVVPVTAAHAAIVTTEQSVAREPHAAANRDKVENFLARQDVREALAGKGLSADAATERVRSMSDAEVAQLADRVDNAPAGGSVLGIIFTVFIVLLVTDILGFTKVFPFTRSIR